MTRFTHLTGQKYAKTLVAKFGPLADKLRDLVTRFGLRPYVVKVIRTRWSGGRRGVGTELVVSETALLPTPKISDLSGIQEIVQAVGLDEVGGILLSKVSPRYTDEQLRGVGERGEAPGPDESVYYEIEFQHPDGSDGERRRFSLASAPYYAAGRLQWFVRLERARGDRARNGDVAG